MRKSVERPAGVDNILKGVRGDCIKGISEHNIDHLMMYHLRSDYWTPELIQQVQNDERTIHLFATNKDKDDHNWKKLRQINSSQRPVAIIKAVTNGRCRSGKKSGHFDEERMPSTTLFCVGCKVALVGINIKPEWGLYHGAIGKVLDIVYRHKEGPHATEDAADKQPAYVMVNFPQYCGPNMYANDDTLSDEEKEERKTWVCIPMVKGRCNNNAACERTYMPLALAFARTIHSFQGASVGKTPPGQPDNTFHRIIADPGPRKQEGNMPGLFYTLLSRATTLGEDGKLETSAILFNGTNMTPSRIRNITKKADGQGLFKGPESAKVGEVSQ